MRGKVITYLVDHYTVTIEEAIKLVDSTYGENEIKSAISFASQPYWPACRIAEAANLKHYEPCVACKIEESI